MQNMDTYWSVQFLSSELKSLAGSFRAMEREVLVKHVGSVRRTVL